jgi:hypothetical protein
MQSDLSPQAAGQSHMLSASFEDRCFNVVMAGLVPAIHVERRVRNGVDARDKPGHDELVGRSLRTEAGESAA